MISLGLGRATRPPFSNVDRHFSSIAVFTPLGEDHGQGRGLAAWAVVPGSITRTDGAGEHEQVRGVTQLGGRHVARIDTGIAS